MDERSDSMKFERKHIQHLWLSLLAALLALTLFPFSAMAVTENVLETAPEIDTTEVMPEENQEEEDEEEYTYSQENDSHFYLPYEQYMPERGTTPEEDQYYYPRLSDGELARYKELLTMLEDGKITLDGIPSYANCMEMNEEHLVRVYTLNPDDFDGETFYVILPWGTKMNDKQLLSLIASFRELGISFDPDSLNERNCSRRAYSGKNRYLSDEEESRSNALRYMIVRGMLTKEDVAPESACVYTEKIPSYTSFCLYPYRSLSDNELAAFLFADYSAWNTDPDLIERATLNAVRSVLRLPLSLSIVDEKNTVEENPWDAYSDKPINWYSLKYESANTYNYTEANDELSDIKITMLQKSGENAELYNFLASYISPYNEDQFIFDNDEAFLTAAEKWADENILLPKGQRPARWSIIEEQSGDYDVVLHTRAGEWDLNLTMSRDLHVTGLFVWNPAIDEAEYYIGDNEDSFVPSDDHPAARSPIPDSIANQPLQSEYLYSSNPWLTDLELSRVRVLTAALDAGEITYEGPSIVNVPFDSKNGVAVYLLNPEDFNGETFYVMLPDFQMNDAQLIALISAFKETGIPFDPDSLNMRNCCRFCNSLETRPLTSDERFRLYTALDKILSGELNKADLAADARAVTVEKTISNRSYGSDNRLFRFYPYRKLTDDELALFIFAELERFDTNPAELMSDAVYSAMDLINLPTNWMHEEASCAEMNIYSKYMKQYMNVFSIDGPSDTTCLLTVKHSQTPGEAAELSGIHLRYFRSNDETHLYSDEEAEQVCIAMAQQWAKENLKLPTENAEWILSDKYGSGLDSQVQLLLQTSEWDIYLWINKTSQQPSECYLYSRKWYDISDEDLDWIISNIPVDQTDENDTINLDALKESYSLANGYSF